MAEVAAAKVSQKLNFDFNIFAFKLGLGVELNNGIKADKYPGLDGSTSPFLDMPVSDVTPAFRMRLKWMPVQWSRPDLLVNIGLEGTYGVAATRYPGSLEMDGSSTGVIHSPGVGAVVGVEYFLDNGLSFGGDLSVGWRGFRSQKSLSLGAYGDKKLSIDSGYIGLQAGIGYQGAKVVAGVDLLFKHYEEFDGLTEADFTDYRVGVSSKAEVGALFFFGVEFSLPGFGVGSRYTAEERRAIELRDAAESAESAAKDAQEAADAAKERAEDAEGKATRLQSSYEVARNKAERTKKKEDKAEAAEKRKAAKEAEREAEALRTKADKLQEEADARNVTASRKRAVAR